MKITKAHYEHLMGEGLLDISKYQPLRTPKRGRASRDEGYAGKKVRVYAIRFLSCPRAISQPDLLSILAYTHRDGPQLKTGQESA